MTIAIQKSKQVGQHHNIHTFKQGPITLQNLDRMELASLLNADLEVVDPFMADLILGETQQQIEKLILVPSVSAAPKSVLQALGSVFQNICAEGYPASRTLRQSENSLKDINWQLADNRRYADRRFYKGVNYIDIVESLAQKRCAELFATKDFPSEQISVNIQSLSGGTANLAVYKALLSSGDTLMSLDLYQGGHLSHGSEFNASGQWYKTVSYSVDPQSELLDYQSIQKLAQQCRPKIIVAGFTSYPWVPNWQKLRDIADEVGAYLLADIAHTAGLVIAGVNPNPVGFAHVVTFTTNKTLCGPRAAVVMSTNSQIAQDIDHAVFPGLQGAPHPNKFAAMAVAFQIARTPLFHAMQRQIVANAQALAAGLQKRGLRLAYGGTNTHLLIIDLKSISSETGFPLFGEPAARILELAGLVVNKNSIPKDKSTALATGIRLGTPWLTQRGFDESDMDTLAGIIHRLLVNIKPFTYNGVTGLLPRAKIALSILEASKQEVFELIRKRSDDNVHAFHSTPARINNSSPSLTTAFSVSGWRAKQFIQQIATTNILNLKPGEVAQTHLLDHKGNIIDVVNIFYKGTKISNQDCYLIIPTAANANKVSLWLNGLSDGYILFDEEDIFRKIEGPVSINSVQLSSQAYTSIVGSSLNNDELYRNLTAIEKFQKDKTGLDITKPYFIGQSLLKEYAPTTLLKPWRFCAAGSPSLKRTPLYHLHKESGAKMMPFAGWEMPLWYSSVREEHRAVREKAGLFDVAHMGVFGIEGSNATVFLDAIFSNYVAWLEDNQSCYGYILDIDGQVIDDAIIYRQNKNSYLMVVNAANELKDWNWLNEVNEEHVIIDPKYPWKKVGASVILSDLKATQAEERQKCNLALQGPASLKILQAMISDNQLKIKLGRLPRNALIEVKLNGLEVIIARTGYTGETWGYELLVHPNDAVSLWKMLLTVGESFGIKPVGLAARDSIRIEAGLPLWGKELSGPFAISPVEAGFAGYVKYHKPFFIGRDALIDQENTIKRRITRFQIDTSKRVRRPQLGDPITNDKGQFIGNVTSCAFNDAQQLLGLAIIDEAYQEPGTSIAIFCLGGESSPKNLMKKDRASLPISAKILSRFPE